MTFEIVKAHLRQALRMLEQNAPAQAVEDLRAAADAIENGGVLPTVTSNELSDTFRIVGPHEE